VAQFRSAIPPPVAEAIRHFHPDLKRSVEQAIRTLCDDPNCGERLQRELEGYWKYKVRRFRIVYGIDRPHRIIRIVAIGHRRTIYEEAAEQIKRRF
jgi:mRNA interferase RelE/StbE